MPKYIAHCDLYNSTSGQHFRKDTVIECAANQLPHPNFKPYTDPDPAPERVVSNAEFVGEVPPSAPAPVAAELEALADAAPEFVAEPVEDAPKAKKKGKRS